MDDEIEMNNFVLESAPKEGHCVALNDVHSSKKEDSLTLSYGGPQTGSRTTKNLSSGDWSYRHTKSSVSLTAKSRTTRWRSHGRRSTFANTRGSALNQEVRISKESTEMKLERIEAFFYNQGMEIALSALYLSMNLLVRGHGAYQFTVCWRMVGDPKLCTLVVDLTHHAQVLSSCGPHNHFSGCIVHTLPQIVNYASRSTGAAAIAIRCFGLRRYVAAFRGMGSVGLACSSTSKCVAPPVIPSFAPLRALAMLAILAGGLVPFGSLPPLILGGDSLRDAAKTWDTRCLRVELLLYVSFW